MKNRIDLIVFGEHHYLDWTAGEVLPCSIDLNEIVKSIQQTMLASADGFVLFLDSNQQPDEDRLNELIEKDKAIDVWFNVNTTGKLNWPKLLDLVAPINYFNMRVPDRIADFSNLSLHGLLLRKRVLLDNAFLDTRFATVEGALKEWVYRSIYSGVLFQHYPGSDKGSTLRHNARAIPFEDQLRFIKYRFGQKWFYWCAMRNLSFGKSFFKIRNEKTEHVRNLDHSSWNATVLENKLPRVTVLIPTIERYPYLVTVLKQLEAQTILPYETIVIDQTPKSERQVQQASASSKINLKYFELEQAGQCSSRNFGLNISTGDYILFIDDDVEIENDLIEKHLRCIQYFNTDVSCGVCDEVGAGPIPKDFSMIRHSEVFPTNNGMVKRDVLKKSGLFDLAYDKGQRADGDLGARVYKTGARMILNPEIRLLHYHAPRGGLRKHKARTVTFASSRQNITHFRMPHITELYFAKIHCSKQQQREQIILLALGTFSIRGNMGRKAVKVAYAFLMLPSFFYKIYRRNKAADQMLTVFPQVLDLQNKI